METMELRWLLFWVFLGNVKCANTMEPPSIIEYCSWSSNSPGRSLSSPRDLPRKVQSRQWCDWKFSQILLMEYFWWEPQVTSIFYMFYDPTTDSELVLNDMLFNADKSHFSIMNIKINLSVMSARQERRLLSLLFTFLILFRRKDIAPTFCTAFDK